MKFRPGYYVATKDKTYFYGENPPSNGFLVPIDVFYEALQNGDIDEHEELFIYIDNECFFKNLSYLKYCNFTYED